MRGVQVGVGMERSPLMRSPRLQMVTWYLPKELYLDLVKLQGALRIPLTRQPLWGDVEALAIHCLQSAVRTLSSRETKGEDHVVE